MKILFPFLLFTFFSCKGFSKVINYTGSTPAGTAVRNFLQISATDSIDFIRWLLEFDDAGYCKIKCNYGIGKPNTNGFIGGGKVLSLQATYLVNTNGYHIVHDGKSLLLIRLTDDLLHFGNDNADLFIGNGAWSYTLNNTHPLNTRILRNDLDRILINDSVIFTGRTPCGIPNVHKSKECYKIKWLLVMYASQQSQTEGTYKIRGTAFENHQSPMATWKLISDVEGRNIYLLNDKEGKPLLRLLKVSKDIMVFVDALDQPLVGNEDFSFTLNRK